MTQKDKLLELFKQYKKLSLTTLYEICSEMTPNTIRRRVLDLVDDDVVVCVDKGVYELDNTENELQRLRAENARLLAQLNKENLYQSVTDYRFSGDVYKFGVVSDSHLGSRFANFKLLNSAYDMFECESIDTVYHVGDITDGENMHKGHEFELMLVGFDAQLEYAVNNYPERKGIKTVLLGGNHDYSFFRYSGADVCRHIANKRPDIQYIGMMEGDINLKTTNGQAKLRLWHPSLGSAYAISYQTQKYIESLPGGEKPNILLIGNFHKYDALMYRNIHAIQPGCTQFQTLWMRSKRIAAVMGFMIVEVRLNENGVVSLNQEFFPDYEV